MGCILWKLSLVTLVAFFYTFSQQLGKVSASTIPASSRTRVVIAGGGPAGLLVAHCLLSRGDKFHVEILESREDPRQTVAGPRSYSLGLNIRGQAAMKHFDVKSKSPGLWGSITPLGVESDSFFLHIGSNKIQLRKPEKKDALKKNPVPPTLLIPRNKLCVGMLENLEKLYSASGRLSITFNTRLLSVDLENKIAEFDEHRHLIKDNVRVSKSYDLIIGADGVQSELRNAMLAEGDKEKNNSENEKSTIPTEVAVIKNQFKCEEAILPGQYKVMLQAMPPLLESDAVHAMEVGKKAGYGLFLIPSPGNNTCALLSWKGDTVPAIFQDNADPAELKASIARNYPLFGEPTDESVAQLSAQRPSAARTVRCNRYHRAVNGQSSALLMGDAAHSTGGTLGQGANSALMDVVALDKCLDETADDLSAALPLFSQRQVHRNIRPYPMILSDHYFNCLLIIFIDRLVSLCFSLSLNLAQSLFDSLLLFISPTLPFIFSLHLTLSLTLFLSL